MAVTPDRRAVILDKAAELFARKGLAATTVREIGEAAGILSGSIYHHFDSKDTIIDAIVSGYFDDLLTRYDDALEQGSDASDRLHRLVLASLACAQTHPHASELFQRNMKYLRDQPRFAYVKDGIVRMRHCWLAVIEAGVEEGVFRDDISPRILYPIIRDGLWRTVEWFVPTDDYPTDALAEDCYAFFRQALAAPGG